MFGLMPNFYAQGKGETTIPETPRCFNNTCLHLFQEINENMGSMKIFTHSECQRQVFRLRFEVLAGNTIPPNRYNLQEPMVLKPLSRVKTL